LAGIQANSGVHAAIFALTIGFEHLRIAIKNGETAMHYVIIGCGAAGVSAASAIRRFDSSGSITLVSFEFQPFYVKPELPDFISGGIRHTSLRRSLKKLQSDPNCTIVSGKRVIKVLPDQNSVIFSDGNALSFNFLLIAAGARPALTQLLAKRREKLFLLRTAGDAVRLRNAAKQAKRAVVFGGGYTAVELLRALYKLNLHITFLTTQELFWTTGIAGAYSDVVMNRLSNSQIEVAMDEHLHDVLDVDGKSYRAVTSKGRELECDLVVVSMGLRPDVDFLEGSGIDLDKGVVVDEQLRTSVSNIYCAGDAAQVVDPKEKLNRINFGWLSAIRQGEVAGKNMAGKEAYYVRNEEPYFIELYGKPVMERW
jgi:nitrite reductase (NADH) large subunit